jgi:nickel/cobalt transporter (NiCoT) family protein
VPHGYRRGSSGVFVLSIGLTAYTLGLRHAFDADHIAATDNSTCKLMSEEQRPLTVGLFFAPGHDTIMFLLGMLVACGTPAPGSADLASQPTREASQQASSSPLAPEPSR